jgi:V/A-type H+-transporting ATPase subunit E
MDVQLQELIDKIKKDGIASAEESADKIINEAQNRAASIISEAQIKAESIIKDAKAETARMEKAGEDAIKQAGRNLLISFRDGITAELAAIVEAKTNQTYSPDLLKKLIPEAVKAWATKSDTSDLAVLLSPKDLSDLQDALSSELKAEISKGLEIKSDKTLSGGFRIGVKDGSAFYDYSAESVSSLFASYLNPKIAKIMKDAASEETK